MADNKASRVLIVDDMPINRMIIASLLATNGVISDQAEGGEECIRMCEEKDYDLILLDHLMPDPDGVDTLVQLKELFAKKKREVPVVCHTIEENRKNINLYKAAGFADVLIKPIDPKQLTSVIMTYLPEDDRVLIEDEKVMPDYDPNLDYNADEPEVMDELDKLPVWLKTVPHIDLVAGVANCETAEDYVDALYVFHSSIEEKSDDIEFSLEMEDWIMYGLRVHSLKSVAALVGARDLSEQAKALEAAANESDYAKIILETPVLLGAYRQFISLLSPLKDLKSIIKAEEKPVEKRDTAPIPNHTRSILFIHAEQGIVPKGIDNNLKKAGFNVISIPDEPDLIITNRFEADIILYLPCECEGSHIGLTMNLLGEICQDDSKILCLIGDPSDIDCAMSKSGSFRVTHCYPRPVNINKFIKDIKQYSSLEKEFHRKKTLYVVDDDPDYLSVIEHWLSADHTVSTFNSGDELLDGLMASTPDLILMDYEMPGMDGCELIKNIRNEDTTKHIPIIFLTGKNDRDHVYSILEYKPDGYLLKSSRKEALLDAINRFFSESVFHRSFSVPRSEHPLL